MSRKIDHGLENPLALDSDTYVVHESGYWVKFEVKSVDTTAKRLHGIQYSLTLHSPENKRLIGFDNAHAVKNIGGPAAKSRIAHDHRHRGKTVRPYPYQNALKLIEDFWEAVDQVLKERTRA